MIIEHIFFHNIHLSYQALLNNMALFWNNSTKITRSKNALFRTGYLISSYAKELTSHFLSFIKRNIIIN